MTLALFDYDEYLLGGYLETQFMEDFEVFWVLKIGTWFMRNFLR